MLKNPYLRLSSLVLCLLSGIMAGCTAIQGPLSTNQIHLADSYGNLKYTISITRYEHGDKIRIDIDSLVLEFSPPTERNHFEEAVFNKINLLGTNRPTPEQPVWKISYVSNKDIDVTLNTENRHAVIEGISLEIPIQEAHSADNLGLSLTGDRLMLPINIDFK